MPPPVVDLTGDLDIEDLVTATTDGEPQRYQTTDAEPQQYPTTDAEPLLLARDVGNQQHAKQHVAQRAQYLQCAVPVAKPLQRVAPLPEHTGESLRVVKRGVDRPDRVLVDARRLRLVAEDVGMANTIEQQAGSLTSGQPQ
ncbi:hypothetical protein PF002_g17768 [Phytophthora fragariae]|uniref:Uncharacterized protein n=1 Tax=Phytophthora fragariae TaxID=53985 RepID=A0A6A3T956_9STRA|nr:hypothetical protein PF006_g15329 [Phytophthora fragariae]KAE9211425.1 hypothetical protein PF004_g15921 [Phytophthora fragariae]KAE9214091.1 hypothetical protein PF002_g17768 [Phytophthora fragariae]KAE9298978.1 hypothetical protein PF001_g15666 [Phytophthora fragariae]